MKKNFIIPALIVIVLAVIVGGLVISNKNQAFATKNIKIGMISPMTGEAASYGEYVTKALKMSVEDFNKNHDMQIEMIYEDGKCDGKQAVTAYTKLVNVDKVKYIVGGFCSGETLAIAPLAEKDHVILFSAGSGSPEITNAGDYIFRNLVSDDFTAKEIANIAVKNGDKKMILISEETDYAEALKKTFAKYYEQQGGSISLNESFSKDATDFRTIITKAKSQDTKNVYLVTQTYKTAGTILKQMKELGLEPKLYTNEAVVGEEALKYYDKNYKGILEGAIFTQPIFNEKISKTATMLDGYKTKYGSTEGPLPTIYLATHYDVINILGEALEKNGDNTDKVKAYLYSIKNWDGAVGKFSFDQNGDAITDVEAKTVKNGEITNLK